MCLSPQGAQEDHRNREGILEYLEGKLSGGSAGGLLRGTACRYVRIEGRVVALDRAKVEEDARYDGKWVLRTNTDLAPKDVALAHKGLWQVPAGVPDLEDAP